MTFLPYPHGGAVFSVSSIAWMSALSHNGYTNPVARITQNVVEAFTAEGSPPWLTDETAEHGQRV
jgi:N,N-dimethylformamidase